MNKDWVYKGKWAEYLKEDLKFPENPEEIFVVGDWHGNYKWVQKELWKLLGTGVKVLVSVGDFGIYPQMNFLEFIHEELEKADAYILVTPGNHEDWDFLDSLPLTLEGYKRITSRIFYLPRGFTWEWQGIKFGSVGGATSVDKPYRTEGLDWFPQEELTQGDYYRATEIGPVDFLITHDCPSGVSVPGVDKPLPNGELPDNSWIRSDILIQAQNHRHRLRAIVDLLSPSLLVHGHYHIFYEDTLKRAGSRDCEVLGLDKDKAPVLGANARYFNLLDLKDKISKGEKILGKGLKTPALKIFNEHTGTESEIPLYYG